ncbi:MAG: M16 family metallopeptidase [Candidatus Hodarchaeales archaeon]|jgi:predicted Zn-dependent peptidase
MQPIIRSYSNLRTVTLGIVTHHGAANDPIPGTTQVLLQTMARGTKKYNEVEIARLIDGTGGSLFSTTEKDFAVVGAQIHPKHALRTLELLFDIIINPTLDESHLSVEKQNLSTTFQQLDANPIRKMLLLDADKAVFGENHPLGRSLIGTPESLTQIKRNNLENTHQDLMINPWGFAVGAITPDLEKQLSQSISDFLSSLDSSKKTPLDFPQRAVPPNNTNISIPKEDGSVYLCINVVTEANSDVIGLTRFSSALLGESFGSRMFSILRDQKAFGYITGSTLKLLDKSLILRCFMETTPDRTREALDSLMEILLDFRYNIVSQDEFSTTHDFILGQLDLSFDDSRIIASRIINRCVHGLSPDIEAGYKELAGVTVEKINLLWKELLQPENLSLVIVGNVDSSTIANWNKNFHNRK